MPLHIPTYPKDAFDRVTVSPNSNEALALKAVRDAPGRTDADLVDAVSLDAEVLDGALYRLRQKKLLVRADDGTYDLSSYLVMRLADALIPRGLAAE